MNSNETNNNLYYTPKQISEIFNVSMPTVYRWIKNGDLTAYKVGQWKIPKWAINNFMDAADPSDER